MLLGGQAGRTRLLFRRHPRPLVGLDAPVCDAGQKTFRQVVIHQDLGLGNDDDPRGYGLQDGANLINRDFSSCAESFDHSLSDLHDLRIVGIYCWSCARWAPFRHPFGYGYLGLDHERLFVDPGQRVSVIYLSAVVIGASPHLDFADIHTAEQIGQSGGHHMHVSATTPVLLRDQAAQLARDNGLPMTVQQLGHFLCNQLVLARELNGEVASGIEIDWDIAILTHTDQIAYLLKPLADIAALASRQRGDAASKLSRREALAGKQPSKPGHIMHAQRSGFCCGKEDAGGRGHAPVMRAEKLKVKKNVFKFLDHVQEGVFRCEMITPYQLY